MNGHNSKYSVYYGMVEQSPLKYISMVAHAKDEKSKLWRQSLGYQEAYLHEYEPILLRTPWDLYTTPSVMPFGMSKK